MTKRGGDAYDAICRLLTTVADNPNGALFVSKLDDNEQAIAVTHLRWLAGRVRRKRNAMMALEARRTDDAPSHKEEA